MSKEITVPTLGESVTEGTIGEWLKKPGDAVAVDEPIASLETDKVAVEVPSPVAGVMGELKAEVGETVEVGAVIAVIEEGGAPAAKGEEAGRAKEDREEGQQERSGDTPKTQAKDAPSDAVKALNPAVRRAVLEHGLDPSTIKGTGRDGRLTKEDVIAAANAKRAGGSTPASSAPAPASTGGERREERVKMTRMRQTIAKRLKGAQENAALLTTFNDVDMSAVMEARGKYKDMFAKKHDIRLGFMGFFAKAACLALKDVPAANAYIEGDEIVYHDYVDISVAVSAPNGLVVPVIRDAQDKNVWQLASEISRLAEAARTGKAKVEELTGGTLTVTSLGPLGGIATTPVINRPEVAIIGPNKIVERPVFDGDDIRRAKLMNLSISCDHRVVDGWDAASYVQALKKLIETPVLLFAD